MASLMCLESIKLHNYVKGGPLETDGQYWSLGMNRTPTVCLEAVKQDGMMLEYAPKKSKTQRGLQWRLSKMMDL